MGLKYFTKNSFHLVTSSGEVSSTPHTLYTVWVEHHLPLLSCLTLYQNPFEAVWKGFSMASPNSSHTRVSNSVAGQDTFCLACPYLLAASKIPRAKPKRTPPSAWWLLVTTVPAVVVTPPPTNHLSLPGEGTLPLTDQEPRRLRTLLLITPVQARRYCSFGSFIRHDELILAVQIMNRVGEIGKPWWSPTPTNNDFDGCTRSSELNIPHSQSKPNAVKFS